MFCDSQIVIITNVVVVSCVSIKRVICTKYSSVDSLMVKNFNKHNVDTFYYFLRKKKKISTNVNLSSAEFAQIRGSCKKFCH